MSLQPLKSSIVNRKVNTVSGKVEWLKIHWISVVKDQPLQFQYRYSMNDLECWKTVDLQRKTKGRPADIGRVSLPPLYSQPRAVDGKKVSDLLELLNYIPPMHHGFYHQLTQRRNDSDAELEDSDVD